MAKKKQKNLKKNENTCSQCSKELQTNDLYCKTCGTPSEVFITGLSAKKTCKETWEEINPIKAKFYTFSIFFALCLLFPTGFLIYFTLSSFLYNNLVILITLPLLMIPLAFDKRDYTISNYFKHISKYPFFLMGTFIIQVVFIFIKLICSGQDPILNIVHFILVLYWLAVIMPYPLVLVKKGRNPVKALIISYKAGKEPRWQQFFILVYCTLINLAGVAVLGLGLLITIPYTFEILKNYYSRLDKLGLFQL